MNIEERLFMLHSDKKETRQMFECSVEELWDELTAINNKVDEVKNTNKATTALPPLELLSTTSTPPSDRESGKHSIEMVELHRTEEAERAWVISQGSIFKTIMNEHKDNSNFKQQLMEVERKLEAYISPRPLEPRLKTSPYANKFKFEETERGRSYTVTKKAVDKQYQLVGEAIPDQGKFYFRIKLCSVPHGYLHLGVLGKEAELEQSSVTADNCINYFGGNGSLNERGNGQLVGKQLHQNDVVTVLIDMDKLFIRFLLRSHVLAEASLKELDLEKGIVPYIELFYGNSKVLVLND